MPPIDASTLLATVLTDVAGPLLSLTASPQHTPAALIGLPTLVPADFGGKGLALAGAVFFAALTVALTVWLHKKIRPERLTPANAHVIHPEGTSQPGGAPSA
ncbi:hypothetical protein [Catellatospora methionotrophica]|uniref:hypothetical protein n=1 Tax=Catellatospora methionotrophica TaxID=121620 RepID=UPI0014072323|nr:hypothetical protein [Catellatospora methionotrophica]